mgnify:CR=1 FL=1
MGEILTAIFGSNSILATIFVSLLPLLELKGGITLGIDEIWGAAALTVWESFGWALLGSCLVIPVIALLFRPIYNWLKTKKFFKAIISFILYCCIRCSSESDRALDDVEQEEFLKNWKQ